MTSSSQHPLTSFLPLLCPNFLADTSKSQLLSCAVVCPPFLASEDLRFRICPTFLLYQQCASTIFPSQHSSIALPSLFGRYLKSPTTSLMQLHVFHFRFPEDLRFRSVRHYFSADNVLECPSHHRIVHAVPSLEAFSDRLQNIGELRFSLASLWTYPFVAFPISPLFLQMHEQLLSLSMDVEWYTNHEPVIVWSIL